MTMLPLCPVDSSGQIQAYNYLLEEQYANAIALYEQAIHEHPEVRSNYWYYGLLLLLQGQEEEAQAAWLFTLSELHPEEAEQASAELFQVLQTESERRTSKGDYAIAWVIRQHIREIAPDQIDNLLNLVELSIELRRYTPEILEEIGLIDHIQAEQCQFNLNLLLSVIDHILDHFLPSPELLELIKVGITRLFSTQAWLDLLIPHALRIGYELHRYKEAAEFLEFILTIQDEPNVLSDLAIFYQKLHEYDRGIAAAKRRLELVDSLPDKIFSSHVLLRGLLGAGGYWQAAIDTSQNHVQLLEDLIKQQPIDCHPLQARRLFNAAYHLAYFDDRPQQWRLRQNQIAEYCQKVVQLEVHDRIAQFQFRDRVLAPTKRLKIGYLSSCMNCHSVGWLARWLFQHHNSDQVEVYAYFLGYVDHYDPVQEIFASKADQVRKISTTTSAINIATQIYQDEIDILVDLDSITLDLTCHILALKPAPIQVTWLGWDASGIPAIDYFIADPYVLPESADTYYSEKIWRLPETYIAVDGFETAAPTLRREDLDIPNDAIVFLSAQRGYKRHRDTALLQMQIIKQVPNSYFLIKGFSDETTIQEFFLQIADEVGVTRDRLRFLKTDPTVPTHRANLAIADVVLDTFPYNGATTTLETLWMEIPIVTRVGKQFAARNSYTMMMNAGVTEGIAFSDREYIEWGVRLGTDEELRRSVVSKLHQSKRSSPLWNGKRFAREMERAYQEMWAIYIQS
jgi:predicted O-linked N-acetylglucosamine transferase (SPINDLY family)